LLHRKRTDPHLGGNGFVFVAGFGSVCIAQDQNTSAFAFPLRMFIGSSDDFGLFALLGSKGYKMLFGRHGRRLSANGMLRIPLLNPYNLP